MPLKLRARFYFSIKKPALKNAGFMKSQIRIFSFSLVFLIAKLEFFEALNFLLCGASSARTFSALFKSLFVALADLVPIYDIPDVLYIVGAQILVL